MTRRRNDNHSTEFGLWLREQPDIDSKLGYITTNLDYVWKNYKTGDWMLIEENAMDTSLRDGNMSFSKCSTPCAKQASNSTDSTY